MTVTVNSFRRFRDLTGHSHRFVARVVSVDTATGTSIVEIRDQEMRVRGTSVPSGNNAVVQDGQITGQAPDLPVFYLSV